jgi:hypothetical protein
MSNEAECADQYGFLAKVLPGSVSLSPTERSKELLRESKWVAMISDWPKYFKRSRAKLESRILKGIPDSVRGQAWVLIIGRSANPRFRPSIAQLIGRGTDPPTVSQIQRDVVRTFPQAPSFQSPGKQLELLRLLHAYSNIDRGLGYTQSMAFIAAMLLLYVDVDTALWAFTTLMKGRHYRLRELYTDGFPKALELQKVWQLLLRKKCRAVADVLDRHNIQFENYAIAWFMCCFLDIDFVGDLRVRIFDRITGFATRATLSFAIVIIVRMQNRIVHGDNDLIIDSLRRPGNAPEMLDWRAVIKTWDRVWMSRKAYCKALEAAGVEFFP